MDWIVQTLAPRSALGWITRVLAFEIVICIMCGFAVFALYPDPENYFHLALTAGVIVSLPFVVLLLALVRYQFELRRRLAVLAATDMLTALPNRRAFFERMAPEGRFLRDGRVLLIDADHFKAVNDTLGHAAGDRCLVAIAEAMRDLLADGDLAARFGGEEFVAFLAGLPADRIAAWRRLLEDGVSVDVAPQGGAIRVTLSGGLTTVDAGESVDAALSRADAALYAAKSAGRARLVEAQPKVRAAS